MPTRILFLDASNEVLLRHKENDSTRSGYFFEHHLKYLLPLKRKWFIGKENVDVSNVDNLNADEVGKKVKEWVDFCITLYEEQLKYDTVLKRAIEILGEK